MGDLFGLKLLILGFAIAIAYQMFRLATMGRRLASGVSDEAVLMDDKRGTWSCMAWMLVFAISLIEMAVHASPASRVPTPLFYVHLTAAVSFLLLVVFLRWQTGKRSRRFHRIAGYSATVLFVTAFSTGSLLLAPL